MRGSSVSYMLSGLNYGSAVMNFVLMTLNVAADNGFAIVNMLFVFLGVAIGTNLLFLGQEQESRGN